MSTSRSLNKVMLIGNLTRNPVLKETSGGATVCTFGIATNTTWKNSDGNIQERTEFHNVVSWNKLGEICAQILSTGMLVYVEGELRTRVWDDDNGVRHYRTEVKIDDMKLLDNKGREPVGIENARSGDAGEVKEKEEDTDEEKEEKSEEDDGKSDEKEEKKKEKKEKKEEAVEKVDDEEITKEAEDLF